MNETLDSFPDVLDHEGAARLLAELCPDDIRCNTVLELNSPDSFSALLSRQPPWEWLELRQVQDARDSGDFEEIWAKCRKITQPARVTRLQRAPPDSVIPRIIERLVPHLQKLVDGRAPPVIWTGNKKKTWGRGA